MATTKKTASKNIVTSVTAKPAVKRPATTKKHQTIAKSNDELVADNFNELSNVVDVLGVTLDLLVQKCESMAYHIIATEEILAEIVAANGINLALVNARIRSKIAAGTDNHTGANQAIDIAAAIASPMPRK